MTDTVRLDEEQLRAARAGDVAALGALLERHRAVLYATALSLLGDPSEAHDAVQDTLLTALARIDDVREPAAVASWLRVVVRNHCLMRIRARRATPSADVERAHLIRLDVDEAIEGLALRDWVWTAIDGLPDDQAVAIMLRYFSRHSSYREIAAVLGIPIGTVRSRLSQARQRLAEELLRRAVRIHSDHACLAEGRTRWWRATVDELHDQGVGHLYATDCVPDVLVEEPVSGYHVRGIDDHLRGVENSVAAGVRLQVTDICASTDITIVEGNYLNPPDDPRHCPATHTEIRIHPSGQTSRLLLYYGRHEEPAAP